VEAGTVSAFSSEPYQVSGGWRSRAVAFWRRKPPESFTFLQVFSFEPYQMSGDGRKSSLSVFSFEPYQVSGGPAGYCPVRPGRNYTRLSHLAFFGFAIK